MRPFHRWLLLLGAPAVALAVFLQAPRPGGGIEAPSDTRRLPPPDAASTFEARSAPVLPLVAVHDAVETGSGWTVLDATGSRLLWLDASGRPVVAAGGAGQGPGEMTRPAAVAVAGEDILVLETLGGPAHRFDGDGRFVERLPPPGGACPFGNLLEAHGRGRDVFVLRACPSPDGILRAHLERWEPGGATRPVHREVVENLRETLSPFRRASAAALPYGVAYGMAHDACARVLSAGGAPRSICPATEARPPLPDAAAERARAVLGGAAAIRALVALPILTDLTRSETLLTPYVDWMPRPSLALVGLLAAVWLLSALLFMVGWRVSLS
ncbi:MAG: hypothetical protein KY453_04375, partial [Gemmatimonadetes bacterium]|nr:hypothetical protein [Gemmatimonadota bacterium]